MALAADNTIRKSTYGHVPYLKVDDALLDGLAEGDGLAVDDKIGKFRRDSYFLPVAATAAGRSSQCLRKHRRHQRHDVFVMQLGKSSL